MPTGLPQRRARVLDDDEDGGSGVVVLLFGMVLGASSTLIWVFAARLVLG